jgi:excisionase family DNA binding protein
VTPSQDVDQGWDTGSAKLIDLDALDADVVTLRLTEVRAPGDELLTKPEYLTKSQAGEIVQLHPKTIERVIQAGELPAFKLREQVRIRRSDLEAWVEAHRIEPATELHDI